VKGIEFRGYGAYRVRARRNNKVVLDVTVNNFFQAPPDRLAHVDIEYSDFKLTETMLKEFLPTDVPITKSKPGMWAERKLITSGVAKSPIDQSTLSCPEFDRVLDSAFIAPNGDWYACCLDDNNDLVLGNVNHQSIIEIATSNTRTEFINDLKHKRYDKIGYPCNTVICCQRITMDDAQLQHVARTFKANKSFMIKQI
jgi:hypothetical protein